MKDRKVANGLGWFSLGLGLTQLLAPRWLSNKINVGDRRTLMRAMGAREIATGVAVLAQQKPAAGLWARVAGDVLDLSLLGMALRKVQRRGPVMGAVAAVLGVGVLDLIYARRLQHS